MDGGGNLGGSAGTFDLLCGVDSHHRRHRWCHQKSAMPAERTDSCLSDRDTRTLRPQERVTAWLLLP